MEIKTNPMHPYTTHARLEKYSKQASQIHAFRIEKGFYLVVKQKPWWMPLFVYRAVIKDLIELQVRKDV